MDKHKKYWAVLPAAGAGQRMGGALPKQYLSLGGKTVIENTLERLVSFFVLEKLVVVVAEKDKFWPTMPISQHQKVQTVSGGKERVHSVLNGLRRLCQWADEDDWVLVHDVARPCVRLSDISLLIEKVKGHPVGGLLACPVQDTMKRSNDSAVIQETVPRDKLWHALTPQMFRLGPLREALELVLSKGDIVTDEAAAMEAMGHMPLLVSGSRDNIKITYPEDLALAQYFLDRQAAAVDL